MPRYGLIGEKLGHSYSAPIHTALGGYPYELIPLAPDALAAFFKAREFAGLNVTIPYKQAVIPYLDELDSAARIIGAVNTIVNRNGRLTGYNTDYAGFLQMLRRAKIACTGKTALVLGNGGVCRPVRAALEREGAAVSVVSRRPAPDTISYEQAYAGGGASILVNATPVGMFPAADALPVELDRLPRTEAVLDLIYNPLRTGLLLAAEEKKLPAAGGLYMLVWQAKAAAELFLGRPIPDARADEVFRRLYGDTCNLVLTGMPMAGKTTVGQKAAGLLGKRFVDADAEIVRRAGREIPALFEQEGEAGFRRREREVLRELSLQTGLVIATGGGAPLFAENVTNLRHNGLIFFLDRPLALLGVGKGRPLARSPEQLAALYREREPVYLSSCDYCIPNGGGEEQAVEALLLAYREAISRA